MAKKRYTEPEEFTNDNIPVADDFSESPFSEEVIEKDYRKVTLDAESAASVDFTQSIPEPEFIRPTINIFEDEQNSQEASGEGQEQEQRSFNPSIEQMPDKEKMKAAAFMANATLDGYAKVKGLAARLATINEKKLRKAFTEGTIDPTIQIPYDAQGNTVTPDVLAQQFNKEVEKEMEFSDESRDNIRPYLTNFYAEKGVGMNNTQMLLYYAGMEVASTSLAIIGFRSAQKEILNALQEQTEMMRSMGTGAMPNQPQSQPLTAEQLDQIRKDAYEAAKSDLQRQKEEPTKQEEAPKPEKDVKPKRKKGARKPPTAYEMPQFGDPEILAEMERIRNDEISKKMESSNGAESNIQDVDFEETM